MISEKENILRYYRHEKPDHMFNFDYLHIVHPARGFLERPLDDLRQTHDWFGVEYTYDDKFDVSLPDSRKAPIISDITKWKEQVVFPDLDAMDWEEAARKDHMDEVDRETKAVQVLIQCGVYERMHSLMGMEECMIAMLEEPEASMELLNAIGDYKCKLISYIIDYYKPDIIRQHDDWGTQISMQMSPDTWREMIKPIVKRIADLCHSKGVAYEQHSCGLIEPIVPDFIEIGIDSWQGMQINNVPELQKKTQGKLLYHMSLNLQNYLASDYAGTLTEEALRKDVRDTVMTCAKDGTYFPILATNGFDRKWWGTNVIFDEIAKCNQEVQIEWNYD